MSTAWSYDHSPDHHFHFLMPTRCLPPEHPVFIPSSRFEFPKIPNIMISALLISVFSLLGKKKAVCKGKFTVDEF